MMSVPKFQVIVTKLGTVYTGNNYMIAACKYSKYIKLARDSGEPLWTVTMLHDGKIKYEQAKVS